jgi:hypothetical protein
MCRTRNKQAVKAGLISGGFLVGTTGSTAATAGRAASRNASTA